MTSLVASPHCMVCTPSYTNRQSLPSRPYPPRIILHKHKLICCESLLQNDQITLGWITVGYIHRRILVADQHTNIEIWFDNTKYLFRVCLARCRPGTVPNARTCIEGLSPPFFRRYKMRLRGMTISVKCIHILPCRHSLLANHHESPTLLS